MAKTFTLREAADLVARTCDETFDGSTLADRARNLVGALSAARSQRRAGEDDDVRDPIGQPVEVHADVGTVIAESLLPLLRRIADPGDG